MGPFFRWVAKRLRNSGAHVSKISFNVADLVYYFPLPDSHLYRGSNVEWPEYLASYIAQRRVTKVILFGDCRPYHRAAIGCVQRLGIEFYVFEEGYLRPNFITFERGGVNGFSSLPRDPALYASMDPEPGFCAPVIKHDFARAALHSITYSLLYSVFRWLTPRYVHHRDLNSIRQGLYWLRGGFRKALSSFLDRRSATKIVNGEFEYFLVPLQVHLDSQISHSNFRDVTEFIEFVVRSFARNANEKSNLVLKVHPLDRPYRNYRPLIEALRRKYALGSRLHYIDVINLPAALQRARGTVVINSTVGLSSLLHRTPTKCLGRAIYDLPGLTHHGTLDDFWLAPEPVDSALLDRFVYFVRTQTQLAGSVWWGFANE
jgi:capsule polysaccharide modification protein KpsS